MHVVGHYHPSVQPIPLIRKESKRISNQVGDCRPPEPTRSVGFVEVLLQFAEVVSLDLVECVRQAKRRAGFFLSFLLGVKSLKPFRAFRLVFEQHILRQRVHKTKRDEVTSPFALYVRQVSAGVDTGTQRIRCFWLDSCGAQLEVDTCNPRISLCREHARTLARSRRTWQRPICGQPRSAELHSAVAQICNLRRARSSNPPRQVERFAEYNSAIQQMENLRYVASRFPRAIPALLASFRFRVSGFSRRSDFGLRMLPHCHT